MYKTGFKNLKNYCNKSCTHKRKKFTTYKFPEDERNTKNCWLVYSRKHVFQSFLLVI